MKESRKQEKGITLIALVLTIIVLMILAAISMVTLTGDNGILTKAQEAKETAKKAEIKEQLSLAELSARIKNKGGAITIKDVLKELEDQGMDFETEEDGRTIIIEETYIWKGTEDGKGNVEFEEQGTVPIKTSVSIGTASLGSYVTYNGLDCRVFYNDDTHGIQIITSENVGNVTLGSGDTEVEASDFTYDGTATIDDNFKKAAASYNNAVDTLNNKAKTYMDTKGIATDARCLGSIPTLTSEVKFQGDTSEMWSGSYQYLTDYKWNNKFKNSDTNYTEDVQQINNLGLNVSSGLTWLASRMMDTRSSGTYFIMRVFNEGGRLCTELRGRVLCEYRRSELRRCTGLCVSPGIPSTI